MTEQTMTAAVLTHHGGPDALELQTVDRPTPGAGEVLVRVGAAAVNNTDVWTREGAYGLPGDPDALAGWRGAVAMPRIQGGDIAGTVTQVGAGVDRGFQGRRVLVDPAIYDRQHPDAFPVGLLGSERDGGFADYVAVSAHRAHPMDDSPLSDAELACLPIAYGTAMGMLERGGVSAGEVVAVTGASGGVGLALVQLATARGATALAVSSGDKLDRVRAAGASATINRDDGDELERIRAAADGPVDAILDVVAGAFIGPGLSLLRDGGRWVVAGALAGHVVDVDIRRLYLRNIALIGSSMHSPTHFDLLARAARRGELRPPIAASYPLGEIHDAQETLVRHEHVGKLVLIPGA